MDISHDREFQKRKSGGRQPARKPVTDTRADEGRGVQDYDLRRGAASGEDTHRRRQNQGREMQAEPAGSPVTEYAGMETGTGSGGAGCTAADSPAGHTDMVHGAEAGYAAGKIQTDTVPEGTAPREYNLRRGAGGPASGEDMHRRRQNQGREMQAGGPVTDYAGMETDTGSGGAGCTADSPSGNTDMAHGAEAGYAAGKIQTDTAPREYNLHRGQGEPAFREDAHRHRQSRRTHTEQPADTVTENKAPRDYDLRREPDMPDTRESARRRRQDQSRKMHAEQTDRKEQEIREADMPLHEAPSYGSGNKETDHGEPAKPDTPFREEPARAGSRRDSRSRQEESRHTVKQHGSKYQQRFQKEAKAEEQAAGERQKKPSKLEFTADELPPEQTDKRLLKAERKAERTERKLDQAEGRLPSRKKLRMETVSDPDTGKVKKRLKIEKEAKTQRAHVKGPAPLRPVKAGANAAVGYAHKKIYEAENENVGIKAAHRTELVGEAGARTAWYRHKTATYRRVEKLQKKSMRAKVIILMLGSHLFKA